VKHGNAQRWLARRWFAALLFSALFARALIPAGYMPGAGGLMLCSGYAPVPGAQHAGAAADTMSGMDMSGMDMTGMADPGAPGPHHGVELCPFAAASCAMAAGHAPLLTISSPVPIARIVFPPERIIPRGTLVPTRLPRGPPAIA